MPYILQEYRQPVLEAGPDTAGELNYFITNTILDYIDERDGQHFNYDRLNEVIGVLECVKQEFYRKVIAPYEDRKCLENGEVY